MDRHAEGALVTNYEDLIPRLCLPDADDRHVLAAAIRGRASVIVTMNLRDFPAVVLAPFGIEARHPDEFVTSLLEIAPELVAMAAENHRQSLKNPPVGVNQYLETLTRQGLVKTVLALQNLRR